MCRCTPKMDGSALHTAIVRKCCLFLFWFNSNRCEDAAITIAYLLFDRNIDNWENITTAPSEATAMKKFKLERTCALCNVLLLFLRNPIRVSPSSRMNIHFIFGNFCSHSVSPIKAVTNRAIAIICVLSARIEDSFVVCNVLNDF